MQDDDYPTLESVLTDDGTAHHPHRRRLFLPLALFVATCVSTFLAGATQWEPAKLFAEPEHALDWLQHGWQSGLIYMAAVIGILLTHEMGHFLQAVRYHVPASYPYFIPLPIMLTGTMGAVIGMEGSRADRKQLFDIGISGPLAGLVVAVPLIAWGIHTGIAIPLAKERASANHLNDPWIFALLTAWLRPELPANMVIAKGPLLMGGWVGMLITGLNMMPVSQLDGGHVIYGLFGKRSIWVARAFVISVVAAMLYFDSYFWVVMFTVVLLLGVDHPSTSDDNVKLGPTRTLVGLASLAIPIFCFTPVPV
jgi:hypothetical protein